MPILKYLQKATEAENDKFSLSPLRLCTLYDHEPAIARFRSGTTSIGTSILVQLPLRTSIGTLLFESERYKLTLLGFGRRQVLLQLLLLRMKKLVQLLNLQSTKLITCMCVWQKHFTQATSSSAPLCQFLHTPLVHYPWNRIPPMPCHLCKKLYIISTCIILYEYILSTTEGHLPFEHVVAAAKPIKTERRINGNLISITVYIENGQHSL